MSLRTLRTRSLRWLMVDCPEEASCPKRRRERCALLSNNYEHIKAVHDHLRGDSNESTNLQRLKTKSGPLGSATAANILLFAQTQQQLNKQGSFNKEVTSSPLELIKKKSLFPRQQSIVIVHPLLSLGCNFSSLPFQFFSPPYHHSTPPILIPRCLSFYLDLHLCLLCLPLPPSPASLSLSSSLFHPISASASLHPSALPSL